MKPAASYSRVSTQEQAESGYSLRTQAEAAQKYASANSLALVEELSDDISGATLDRPGLTRLRELVKVGTVQAVIIYSPDRLSRSMIGLLTLRDEFVAVGCEIHYVRKGKLDLSGEGVLLDNVEGAIAEYERGKIVERTQRGKIAKIQAGKVLGAGPRLYGYRRQDNQLVICESEAQVIRRIFDWYINDRMGLGRIAVALSKELVPSPGDARGLPRRGRKPGSWMMPMVARILRCSAYSGMMIYHTQSGVLTVPVPAIVSAEQFQEAERIRAANRAYASRNAKRLYLLRGMIRCGKCGCRFVGSARTKKPPIYLPIYRREIHELAGVKCDEPSFLCSTLDDAAWDYAVSVLKRENLEAAIAEITSGAQSLEDKRHAELAQAGEDLAVCESEAHALAARLAQVNGVVGAALESRITACNERHAALLERKALLSVPVAESLTADRAVSLVRLRDELLRRLDNASPQDKRVIFERMRLDIRVQDGCAVIRSATFYWWQSPPISLHSSRGMEHNRQGLVITWI